MFNSPILDLIILLAFTYFMGSLLLSTINESIANGLFRLRQNGLKNAMELLFLKPEWKTFVQKQFIKSPHIQSLMRDAKKYPAYIPANNFILTVIQMLGSKDYVQGKLQETIANATLPEDFKQVLQDIAAKADNKLEGFEKGLTQFYNDAMDRAGGWYKKRIRLILLLLGFGMSAALNLDTIKIADDALNNKQQLKETVDKIVANLANIQVNKDSLTTTFTIKGADGKVLVSQKSSLDTVVDRTAKSKNTKASVESFHTIQLMYENTSSLSLGYKGWADAQTQWTGNSWAIFFERAGSFLKKLLGVLITAFALQLGSNYWFDMLNKAVNIRAVGKKPEEKAKEK